MNIVIDLANINSLNLSEAELRPMYILSEY